MVPKWDILKPCCNAEGSESGASAKRAAAGSALAAPGLAVRSLAGHFTVMNQQMGGSYNRVPQKWLV